MERISNIRRHAINFNKLKQFGIDPEVGKVLDLILRKNKSQRPDHDYLLNHPSFKNVDHAVSEFPEDKERIKNNLSKIKKVSRLNELQITILE